jgi:replication factor C subunit 1
MPVDIRKFFNKTDAARKKPSSASSPTASAERTAQRSEGEFERAASSADAGGRRLKSNKGSYRSPPKSPPKKKVKKLAIDDDTTDEDDNDNDSDEVKRLASKAAAPLPPQGGRGGDRNGTATDAGSKKKRKSDEHRVEMSVGDFFGTSTVGSTALTGSSGKSPAKKQAAPSSTNANNDNDDDDVAPIPNPHPRPSKKSKKQQQQLVEAPDSPLKSPAKKGSRSRQPSDANSSTLLRPSEPYSGNKPLKSDDLRAGCLSGLTFCFTGVLESVSRDAATELVKELGGRVTTAVSSKTDYLVAGPLLEDGRPYEEGSKHKKALQNGRTVVVVGEPLFFGLLLQLDARTRMRAGEPPSAADDDDGAVPSGSSTASPAVKLPPSPSKPGTSKRSYPTPSTQKIEPSSFPVESAGVASNKKQPQPSSASSATSRSATAAAVIKNPYAVSQKFKSNPYAKNSSTSALGKPPSPVKKPALSTSTSPATNGVGMLWVDKHKPQNTKQILGNQDSATKLAAWLRTWEAKFNTPAAIGKSFGGKQGPWKAALLSGPPGIGSKCKLFFYVF